MGMKYGRLGGDQKSLIEFRRIFLRGFQGCQEKQQMEQQNGNLVENEEVGKVLLNTVKFFYRIFLIEKL